MLSYIDWVDSKEIYCLLYFLYPSTLSLPTIDLAFLIPIWITPQKSKNQRWSLFSTGALWAIQPKLNSTNSILVLTTSLSITPKRNRENNVTSTNFQLIHLPIRNNERGSYDEYMNDSDRICKVVMRGINCLILSTKSKASSSRKPSGTWLWEPSLNPRATIGI